LALGVAGQAQAISITGLTITANGPNSADGKTDTVTNYNEVRSARTILDSGGSALDSVGSSVNAQTRYSSVTVADGGVATTASRNATHDYKITFPRRSSSTTSSSTRRGSATSTASTTARAAPPAASAR
jgi:hypothetical protein